MNTKSIQILKKYLDLEKKFGGYELQEKSKAKLDKFYKVIAKLINSEPSEISFMPISTLSWNFVLNSIPLRKNDDILIKIAKKNKVLSYRGSDRDVLDRMLSAIKKTKVNIKKSFLVKDIQP